VNQSESVSLSNSSLPVRTPRREADSADEPNMIAAARDLLARTAELPGSKRGLLAVLGEYRRALFDLVAESEAPH
jgi:hypothetical protein